MGGNHVIGLISHSIAVGSGHLRGAIWVERLMV